MLERRNSMTRQRISKCKRQIGATTDTNGTDYDYIYNNSDERDNWNSEQAGVFRHLVGQVDDAFSAPVRLCGIWRCPPSCWNDAPLLEMYADFFAHPDELIAGAYENTPEKRFLAVLKYYLNSFYPARKTDNAKKPYNPILGEVFRCRWTLPDVPVSASRTAGGPFPRSATNQMTFIGEQVSHHPPISAFYVEHPESGVTCTSYIYTEAHIAGLTSVGVRNIGRATVQLQNHNETYMATFPDALRAQRLRKAVVELSCLQTGYSAKSSSMRGPCSSEVRTNSGPSLPQGGGGDATEGDWRGEIVMKRTARGAFKPFTNVRAKCDVTKECVKVLDQKKQRKPKIVASSHRCSVLQRHKNGGTQALHRATPAGRGQASAKNIRQTPVGGRRHFQQQHFVLSIHFPRFFPPVESANATDGETVAKWLFTPNPDGGPKWLKCLVNSSLDQLDDKIWKQLRTVDLSGGTGANSV
ncbi:hypothetical protein niasHT_001888 [Heterodera trifolii]|uniref:Oxysterol-binding protein n=1 Tax=Heterodera trifolii TaxID=157864 RepID=A0ABD2LNX6_9BILA